MNTKAKAIWILLLLAAAIGCDAPPLTPQAAKLLQSGYDAYAAGRNEQALNSMDEFLLANSHTNRADEGYLLRAQVKRKLNDIDGAKADFNEALSESRKPEMQARALVELGEIAYQADGMALAENMYRQAMENTERGQPPSDRAHFGLGCVLQRQGRWEQADVHFDRVVYFFNGSELAKLSARRTHATGWTVQTGAFDDAVKASASTKALRSAGLEVHTKAILYDKRPRHVVLAGRYPTYEQATAALGEAQKFAADAFVTPTR